MKTKTLTILMVLCFVCGPVSGIGRLGDSHPSSYSLNVKHESYSPYRYPDSYPYQSGRPSAYGHFKFDSGRYYGKDLYVPSPGYHFYSWPGYNDDFWGIDWK